MSVDETLKNPKTAALLIDHTVLKPEAAEEDIARACAEARQFGFASVCVNPYWVRFAAAALDGSGVNVCTAIGFPLGGNQAATKLAEADLALLEGATELDVVQNIGALRSGHLEAVRSEIMQLAARAHARGAILKVILETCLLTEEEKVRSCRLAIESGADFVKTSTGFSKSGATVEDVKLMRQIAGNFIGVKAAGGIRSLETFSAMLHAGASRIGTSSGVEIMRELQGTEPGSEAQPLPAARVPGGHPDTY